MKSFLLISSGLMVCVIFHTIFRFWGYTKAYSERLSPLFPKQINHVFYPELSTENYSKSLEQIKEVCQPSCLLAVDTYYTKDNKIYILSEKANRYQHLGKSEILNSEELLKRNPEALSLASFVETFPQAKGYLHIEANTPGIVRSLISTFEGAEKYKNFIFCSNYGNVVRSLRKEKPHWKTCASQDEETKAHILSSIYLESIAGLPTEHFFFSSLDLTRYSDRLYHEIARRTYFSAIPFENASEQPHRIEVHKDFASFLSSKNSTVNQQ